MWKSIGVNIFDPYGYLEFHASKREQLNCCCFEGVLRIAVWGLFIFRGGAFLFKNAVIAWLSHGQASAGHQCMFKVVVLDF